MLFSVSQGLTGLLPNERATNKIISFNDGGDFFINAYDTRVKLQKGLTVNDSGLYWFRSDTGQVKKISW